MKLSVSELRFNETASSASMSIRFSSFKSNSSTESLGLRGCFSEHEVELLLSWWIWSERLEFRAWLDSTLVVLLVSDATDRRTTVGGGG